MYKSFTVLAVIPARGGSKGVPGKNIRAVGGRPLIAHSIRQAQASKYVDRVIVSTDDSKIAAVARRFGADVPFIRPKKFAQDLTPDFPVFTHCLSWLAAHENYRPDILVHLRPTGPLRTSRQIDDAIALLVSSKADSVRTVHKAAHSPFKMWLVKGKRMEPFAKLKGIAEAYNAPRQSLPKVYQANPHVGAFWRRTVEKKKSIFGKRIAPLIVNGPVADIDSEIDFAIVEQYLKKRSQ